MIIEHFQCIIEEVERRGGGGSCFVDIVLWGVPPLYPLILSSISLLPSLGEPIVSYLRLQASTHFQYGKQAKEVVFSLHGNHHIISFLQVSFHCIPDGEEAPVAGTTHSNSRTSDTETKQQTREIQYRHRNSTCSRTRLVLTNKRRGESRHLDLNLNTV